MCINCSWILIAEDNYRAIYLVFNKHGWHSFTSFFYVLFGFCFLLHTIKIDLKLTENITLFCRPFKEKMIHRDCFVRPSVPLSRKLNFLLFWQSIRGWHKCSTEHLSSCSLYTCAKVQKSVFESLPIYIRCHNQRKQVRINTCICYI